VLNRRFIWNSSALRSFGGIKRKSTNSDLQCARITTGFSNRNEGASVISLPKSRYLGFVAAAQRKRGLYYWRCKEHRFGFNAQFAVVGVVGMVDGRIFNYAVTDSLTVSLDLMKSTSDAILRHVTEAFSWIERWAINRTFDSYYILSRLLRHTNRGYLWWPAWLNCLGTMKVPSKRTTSMHPTIQPYQNQFEQTEVR